MYFIGHDQCAGELIEREGKKYKLFYGMSSSVAMDKHAGKKIWIYTEWSKGLG